ncbi:MAG: trimethylamine methyltransferase family protein [Promethearchaeota archaeon]
MRLNKLEVFSKNEIEQIHSATMDLLSTVGIKIDSEETKELLANHGAELDENSNFVKFPETLVKEQLKHVPSSFKLHGPDGSFNFEVIQLLLNMLPLERQLKCMIPLKKKEFENLFLQIPLNRLKSWIV